jgi:hypothetical protein
MHLPHPPFRPCDPPHRHLPCQHHPPPALAAQAKEGFFSLLDECRQLEVRDGQRPKFSKARDLLELDPRWQAVDSNREREELYEDWLDEKEKAVRPGLLIPVDFGFSVG